MTARFLFSLIMHHVNLVKKCQLVLIIMQSTPDTGPLVHQNLGSRIKGSSKLKYCNFFKHIKFTSNDKKMLHTK
jgi:hypothetical protein